MRAIHWWLLAASIAVLLALGGVGLWHQVLLKAQVESCVTELDERVKQAHFRSAYCARLHSAHAELSEHGRLDQELAAASAKLPGITLKAEPRAELEATLSAETVRQRDHAIDLETRSAALAERIEGLRWLILRRSSIAHELDAP